MRNHYVSPRRKQPKINWDDVNGERRGAFEGAIEKAGTIGQALLKIQLKMGDGIFERTKRDVLELYSDMYSFNKTTKLFSYIDPDAEKQIKLEQPIQNDWEMEL